MALALIFGAFTDSAGFVALVSTLLGGGVIGAVAAFRKAGPEVESISVATMKGVIAELRAELDRLAAENAKLRSAVEALEHAAEENIRLRARLDALEDRASVEDVRAARREARENPHGPAG